MSSLHPLFWQYSSTHVAIPLKNAFERGLFRTPFFQYREFWPQYICTEQNTKLFYPVRYHVMEGKQIFKEPLQL